MRNRPNGGRGRRKKASAVCAKPCASALNAKDTEIRVGIEMEYPHPTPPLPADYYRRHAARVRQLASDATTATVKEHLREVALEYDRLAERADFGFRISES